MLSSNERLKKYFEENNIGQESIANSLKVSQPYISSILTGKKGIGLSTIQKISKTYNLSVNWILNGEDPKFTTKLDESIPIYKTSLKTSKMSTESKDYAELLEDFMLQITIIERLNKRNLQLRQKVKELELRIAQFESDKQNQNNGERM